MFKSLNVENPVKSFKRVHLSLSLWDTDTERKRFRQNAGPGYSREQTNRAFCFPFALRSFDTISSSVLSETGTGSHFNLNLTVVTRTPFWNSSLHFLVSSREVTVALLLLTAQPESRTMAKRSQSTSTYWMGSGTAARQWEQRGAWRRRCGRRWKGEEWEQRMPGNRLKQWICTRASMAKPSGSCLRLVGVPLTAFM